MLEGLSLQYCHTLDLALEDKLNSLRAFQDAKARNTKGNYILCCALPMLPSGNLSGCGLHTIDDRSAACNAH